MTGAPQTTHPDLFLIATDFDEIGQMFTSLAESACLAFDADTLPDNFSTGMDGLFRHVMTRFSEANKALYDGWEIIRRELECIHIYASHAAVLEKQIAEVHSRMDENETSRRLFFPRRDEVIERLMGKLITIAENAYLDIYLFVNEIEGRKLARDYAMQIIDRIEDDGDPMEAGSLLPWAELEIRKELAKRIADNNGVPKPADDIRRTLDRLSARAGDGVADDVREKIEKAADAS